MVRANAELLVADSFRVRLNPQTGAAEARALSLHLHRFTETALEERAALSRIETFLAEALPRIREFGDGWPRLELWRETGSTVPRLSLALRPLPQLTETIELRSVDRDDPRLSKLSHPERKGPNIERYSALNRAIGAEALLTDEHGYVLEGATTSLVWWPSGTGALGPADGFEPFGGVVASAQRVRSVTESLIVDAGGRSLIGRGSGLRHLGPPQPLALTARQLSGRDSHAAREVWAVNALHGIRVVTGIDGHAMPAPEKRRLRWFREALDRSWEPLDQA